MTVQSYYQIPLSPQGSESEAPIAFIFRGCILTVPDTLLWVEVLKKILVSCWVCDFCPGTLHMFSFAFVSCISQYHLQTLLKIMPKGNDRK